MKAITLFALAVQALSASASLVKRVPYSPSLSSKRSDAPLLPRVQAPECVCPGEYLCCSELVSSADKIHYDFYDTLGVNLTGTNIQIGVACQRINFVSFGLFHVRCMLQCH